MSDQEKGTEDTALAKREEVVPAKWQQFISGLPAPVREYVIPLGGSALAVVVGLIALSSVKLPVELGVAGVTLLGMLVNTVLNHTTKDADRTHQLRLEAVRAENVQKSEDAARIYEQGERKRKEDEEWRRERAEQARKLFDDLGRLRARGWKLVHTPGRQRAVNGRSARQQLQIDVEDARRAAESRLLGWDDSVQIYVRSVVQGLEVMAKDLSGESIAVVDSRLKHLHYEMTQRFRF